MRTFTKEEVHMDQEGVKSRIFDGEIFIYPTDTIYGIGCNALIEQSVEKVREIKSRDKLPFSVIAPNKRWIYKNCEVNATAEEWIEKLPGPYTLILKLKNKDAIPAAVNVGLDTIGVRMPKHWFSDIAKELDIPIVTTSANLTGKKFMETIEELDPEIKKHIQFIIYEGKIKGRPSKLVHLDGGEVKIKER